MNEILIISISRLPNNPSYRVQVSLIHATIYDTYKQYQFKWQHKKYMQNNNVMLVFLIIDNVFIKP